MAFNTKKLAIDQNLVHLYIVYGLPGSGKTTFLRKKFDFLKSNRDFEFFNIDFYMSNLEKYKNLESYFKKTLEPYYLDYGKEYNFVVDGLFCTPDEILSFVNKIAEYYGNCVFEVQVYAWNEDRDACLNNDEQRLEDGSRGCPAANTIKNAVFVPLTDDDLHSENDRICYLPIEHQTVQRATTYEKFFNRQQTNNDELCSIEWCVGGERRDCYGNTSGAWTDDARDFDELDEFLEQVCPQISFLLYKKIKRECVTLEKRHENDYYGYYDYNYWRCDLKKLYQILKDNDILND